MKKRILSAALLTLLSLSTAHADQTITLDGATAGKMFEGVGAVSGGGATSVLLKDYAEPQRSQVLDLLFKPNFGASMQTLYIEVGGDGNSTQGTEQSFMHTRTDENFQRGYEWWLMSEAKKRNSALSLDACAWSAPSWIGQRNGTGNGQFWSQDMADYYVKWIKGLKTNYGLDLDAIGCRNEKGENVAWVKTFRKTLNDAGLSKVRIHAFDSAGGANMWKWVTQMNTDTQLAAAVDIIGNHCLNVAPPSGAPKETIDRLQKPVWNTEDHIYNSDGRNFKDDYAAALGAVHFFNANYIEAGATKMVNWYLVGSTYPIEPYYQQPPAMFASSPWSGHFSLKPIIWSYAHYGQFTKIGWHYLGAACTKLTGGGTLVALKSDANDFSIIAETAGSTAAQTLTFKVAGGLSNHALCVWRTTRDSPFAKQTDITPAADGTFSLTLDPDAIYSLSTTTGQQKGAFADVPEKPFPFPYYDDFKSYTDPKSFGYLPHYTADISGVFELADLPDNSGKCLRQVLDTKAQSWAPEWMPYTILGDSKWKDYEVSADIYIEESGWAGVMGRINNTGGGYGCNPKGYYFRLSSDGTVALFAATQPRNGNGNPGTQLATGKVDNIAPKQWHNVKIQFTGTTITGLVDNVKALQATDTLYPTGMAGLVSGGENNARNTALYKELIINTVNAPKPKPTPFPKDFTPMYKKQ